MAETSTEEVSRDEEDEDDDEEDEEGSNFCFRV